MIWAYLKSVPAVLKLLNTLSRWWENYEIRKAERAKIKNEIYEELKKEARDASKTRDRLDADPDYRDGVRKKFTRK